MSSPDPLDRLQRALDVWLEYSAGDGSESRESFLARQDASLRPLLEDFFQEHADDADTRGESDDAPTTIGDFRLVRELGRGGMGVVHEAIERSIERRVALKILDPGIATSATGLERFRREAAAAARLRHDGMARLYAVGQDDGVHWLAMEMVDGKSLSKLIREATRGDTRIAPGQAAEWVAQLAEALAYAHGEGIVHRDLKPHNVIVDASGRARLIDFGLAKFLDRDHATLTAGFAGSLAYASPEQVRGASDLDARTDIWSLGVVLYELLTLERPFRGEATETLMHAIAAGDPQPPQRGPQDLRTICMKCLEKDPERRYQDAQSLADDLHRFLRHEEIEAVPPSAMSRLVRLVHRRRVPIFATAAVLALVGISISFALFREGAKREIDEALAGAETSLRSLVRLSAQPRALFGPIEPFRERFEASVRESERLLSIRPDNNALRKLVAESHERAAQLYQKLKLQDEAFRAHDRAIALCKQVLTSDPTDHAARDVLATSYHNRHIYERALGQHEKANEHLTLAIEAWEPLTTIDDIDRVRSAKCALALALTNRAEHLMNQRDVRVIELQRDLERAHTIWKEVCERSVPVGHIVNLLRSHGVSATLASREGKLDEAIRIYESAMKRLGSVPTYVQERGDVQSQRALLLSQSARIHRVQRRFDKAEELQREAIEVYEALAATGSKDAEISLLSAEFGLVALMDESGVTKPEVVEPWLDRAETRAERLAAKYPDVTSIRENRVGIATVRAYQKWTRKEAPNTVREAFGRAQAMSRELIDDERFDSRSTRIAHAQLLGSYGSWLVGQGSAEEAARALEPALQTIETYLEREPANEILRRNMRTQSRALARAWIKLKSHEGLVDIAARIRGRLPDDPESVGFAVAALDQAIVAHPQKGRAEFGEEVVERCLTWMKDADERGVAWRASRWMKSVRWLPRHRAIKARIDQPKTKQAK